MRYLRLYPDPRPVELAEQLTALQLPDRAGAERPYTITNLISAVDGRGTFQGRSGALGDDGDRAMFRGLREQADAIVVGTSTLRTEHYGRLIAERETRERRVAAGRAPEPLACVISPSGRIPIDVPLFAEPEARIVVFTGAEFDPTSCAAQVEVVRLDPAQPIMTAALSALRADHDVRVLLCEGGPTLFALLLRERLVDELFLTLAPKLVGGGEGPTITSGPELPQLDALELRWTLERQGTLFLRYGLG